jgi:hypothetical protein
MKRAGLVVLVLVASWSVIPATPASATNVNVGVTISPPPPPPPVLVATPRFVVIPGSPVQYAPGVSFNLFIHSGRYYSFHNGVWFHSPRRGGPWAIIAMERVPHVVRAVPVTYFKVPPGHARKHDGPPMGYPGKGPKHR